MVLSGISQMWMFSLYEFLRTWRQKAKHIMDTAAEYKTVQPRKRQKVSGQRHQDRRGQTPLRQISTFYLHQLSRIPEDEFVAKIKTYFDKTEGLFKELSAVRVMLAKHEIAGKEGLVAEAPGYGRMSYFTGSIYWHYTDRRGFQSKVERREMANEFLGIDSEFVEEI